MNKVSKVLKEEMGNKVCFILNQKINIIMIIVNKLNIFFSFFFQNIE